MLVLKKNSVLFFVKDWLEICSLLLFLELPLISYANTIEIDSSQTYLQNVRYYLDEKFNIQLTEDALTSVKKPILSIN